MRQDVAIRVRERQTGRLNAPVYTPVFMTEVITGGGAWRREARVVLALAAQQGLVLDEQALIFSDVRDLQALALHLQAWAPHTKGARVLGTER
jgi:hypothetical protein